MNIIITKCRRNKMIFLSYTILLRCAPTNNLALINNGINDRRGTTTYYVLLIIYYSVVFTL